MLNCISGFLRAYLLYPLAARAQKRTILSKARQLRRESRAPFPERQTRAQQRLVHILAYAKANVPYYRDLFASLRFDPEKVSRDVRALEQLPYLTKDIVREQGKRLLAEQLADRPLHQRKTGSSTGPSTLFYYDADGLDWTAAENILVLEWAGKKRFHREAHLSTPFLDGLPPADARREARKCFVLNRTNVYTRDYGDAGLASVWEALRRARPRLVQGHPSTLFALAGYVARSGLPGAGVFRTFESTGEMLTQKQRERIEGTFRCRVINRYGAAEFGVMAHELASGPQGRLRVVDSLVYPEVLPMSEADPPFPDGEPRSGERIIGSGELIFTSLRNLAMPLIRYRMGDMGTLTEEPTGWWLSHLVGRVHDVVTVGGVTYPTHFLQDVIDRYGYVENMQIAMRNGQVVEVRLVLSTPSQGEYVLHEFARHFPGTPCRLIEAKDLVFSGWRKKYRYVVEMES